MPEHLTIWFYAAASLGAVLLTYFLLRAGRLNAAPAAGSGLARYGKDLRLRDIYRAAVMMEEEGASFYLKMGVRAQNPDAKKLCFQLAEAETEHRRFFLGRLAVWRRLPPNRLTWPAFMAKIKEEGLFGSPPADGADEDEMAAFAIRQEQKTAEFYRLFETAFPETWKCDSIGDLVKEELSHAARLRALYPKLP